MNLFDIGKTGFSPRYINLDQITELCFYGMDGEDWIIKTAYSETQIIISQEVALKLIALTEVS